MNLKEMRKMLREQMVAVKEHAENIPQAESMANLAGKMLKAISQEIQAEEMRSRNINLKIFDEILG